MVEGTQPKKVIIRALGPELAQYGVPDALADPTLELHDHTGALIASNNDWQHTILGGIITKDQVKDMQNSSHAPTHAGESAIVATLPSGTTPRLCVARTSSAGLLSWKYTILISN